MQKKTKEKFEIIYKNNENPMMIIEMRLENYLRKFFNKKNLFEFRKQKKKSNQNDNDDETQTQRLKIP